MIQSMHSQLLDVLQRPQGQTAAGNPSLTALFGDNTKTATQNASTGAGRQTSLAEPEVQVDSYDAQGATASADNISYKPVQGTGNPLFGGTAMASEEAPVPAASNDSSAASSSPGPANETTVGKPDIQDWLNSYYAEMGDASEANAPYQAASGAPNNYPAGSVYGPEQIYTQALYNQGGNAFAALTGGNPADFTSQLPGIPTTAAQQEYDALLANENAQRLAAGQPIDTAAYWSDPGPVSYDGVTYTSQELGYAGPGQSSGPEPIYISQGEQIQGTNSFMVPGYNGTVTGIQPNRYYTLQQLEQAGLKAGQPDAQFHPGSWTTTEST
jgi:hypothetical protein